MIKNIIIILTNILSYKESYWEGTVYSVKKKSKDNSQISEGLAIEADRLDTQVTYVSTLSAFAIRIYDR